jgi:hypothetical protein
MARHHKRTNSHDLTDAYCAAGRFREAGAVGRVDGACSPADDACQIRHGGGSS